MHRYTYAIANGRAKTMKSPRTMEWIGPSSTNDYKLVVEFTDITTGTVLIKTPDYNV